MRDTSQMNTVDRSKSNMKTKIQKDNLTPNTVPTQDNRKEEIVKL